MLGRLDARRRGSRSRSCRRRRGRRRRPPCRCSGRWRCRTGRRATARFRRGRSAAAGVDHRDHQHVARPAASPGRRPAPSAANTVSRRPSGVMATTSWACMSENHSRPSRQRGPSGKARPSSIVSSCAPLAVLPIVFAAEPWPRLTPRRHRPARRSPVIVDQHGEARRRNERMDGETGTLAGRRSGGAGARSRRPCRA